MAVTTLPIMHGAMKRQSARQQPENRQRIVLARCKCKTKGRHESAARSPVCRTFFPLNSAGPMSWPLPEYVGYGSNGAGTVSDALFGSAVFCIKASQVSVTIAVCMSRALQ